MPNWFASRLHSIERDLPVPVGLSNKPTLFSDLRNSVILFINSIYTE